MGNIKWSVLYKCKNPEPCLDNVSYDKNTNVYTRKYDNKEDAVVQFIYKSYPFLLTHVNQYSDVRIFKGNDDYTENLIGFLKE